MTLMKKKKIYTAPALEVFEFEGENLLSGSKDIGIYDEETDDDAKLTNKKDPNNPWEFSWE